MPNLSGLTLLLGNKVVGGTTVTGEVTISGAAPHGGQQVTFNLDPTSTGSKISTVTVPSGATSTTFSVTFKAVTKNTTSTIWANSGNNGGATLNYPVTVTPGVTPPPPTVTLSSLTVSAASVVSGSPVSLTVYLTAAAPSSGAVVALSSSPTISGFPASVVVPAGSPSATVTVTAPPVSVSTTCTITGTYGTSAHVSFGVTPVVAPPTPPIISITAPAAGATVSGTIVASANASDAQGIASVAWELDGSTSLGTDTAAPYTESIDTTKIANGSHTLTAIAKDVAGLTTASSGVAVTVNNTVTPPPPSGSLASGLGTPSFQDSFNYTSVSGAFSSAWQISTYLGSNYAGAGSNVQFAAANISFPIGPNGVPVLCLKLSQSSAGASSGAEILTNQTFGYGTYEFCSRMGSTSSTPSGSGSSVSGSVSSTFLISNNNGGTTGYVEIDAPECEGNHPTWAEYDIWFNSDSGGNTAPSGGNFLSQGPGADTYLVVPTLATGFNYYGFVWAPGSLKFYLNGVYQGESTTNVPVPSTGGNIPSIDINHYGTNGSGWGGSATVGTTRYFYVQSAKYWSA